MTLEEKVLNLIGDKQLDSYLYGLSYHGSFTKPQSHLFNIYQKRLAINQEVTHAKIMGLNDLVLTLTNIDAKDNITVSVFTNEHESAAVFTNEMITTLYGIVRGVE